MYVAELDPGIELQFEVREGWQAYVVCMEGGVTANGSATLNAKDALEVKGKIFIFLFWS